MWRMCERDAWSGPHHQSWRPGYSCKYIGLRTNQAIQTDQFVKDYLVANYCPTQEDQDFCVDKMSRYYVGMLVTTDVDFSQTNCISGCHSPPLLHGWSPARLSDHGSLWCLRQEVAIWLLQTTKYATFRYTCEECVQGLEWVEAYLEDPTMVAEFVVYLEQNFCLSDWDDCKEHVKVDFPRMHMMAMEKFMIPTEICNNVRTRKVVSCVYFVPQEPVCGATPDPNHPTHPHPNMPPLV